jgi:hypothetical protein
MKKNVMLKIASVLMVAVLLTTCAISSTFAKYTTSASEFDEARVAKFGVTVTTKVKGLFATTYGDTVSSGVNVVAPGTDNGTFTATSEITGQPEVDVKVVTVGEVTLANWEVDGKYYCPLVVTVGNNEPLDGTKYQSMAEFKAAIEAFINDTHDYDAGTLLTDEAKDIAIKWSWAYETQKTVEGKTELDTDRDYKDTQLGNAAAENETNAPSIKIEVTQTVTQID